MSLQSWLGFNKSKDALSVKAVPAPIQEQCRSLFDDYKIYSDDRKHRIYPSLYTVKDTTELMVAAPVNITPEKFEKVLYGLSTVFGKTLTGIEDHGSHKWVLYEDKLPKAVSYDERPEVPEGELWLGINSRGKHVTISFEHSPVMLITGASGSGKSELLKVIIEEIKKAYQFTCGAEIYIADSKGLDFSNILDVKIADEYELILKLYEETFAHYQARKGALKKSGCKNWLQYVKQDGSMKPLFIIADEASDYLNGAKKGQPGFEEIQKITAIASELARKSRAVGIYQIVSQQNASMQSLNVDIKNNAHFRISYALPSSEQSRVIFDSDIAHDDSLRAGIGVIKASGQPIVFKGALIK
jgi:DNA segregation ATPase FtsK/SpoIIIE-like protein